MIHIPLGNKTALNHEIIREWVPQPQTRGTADILYTCVVTIVLCVFTAVHLNLPAPKETTFQRLLRKWKWTATGIFAPEVILFSAWNQFSEAWSLVKILNEEHRKQHGRCDQIQVETVKGHGYQIGESQDPEAGSQTKNEKHAPQSPYNLSYGFFAVMGGFRYNNSYDTEEDSVTRTLEPELIAQFARLGRFTKMDSETITARSKADGLAKVLVCAQVTWLVVQCIARKLSGLPLTILEIHTFVHVVCALAIYSLWYQKPLDATEATIIDPSDSEVDQICLLQLYRKLNEPILSYTVSEIQYDLDITKIREAIETWNVSTDIKPETIVEGEVVLPSPLVPFSSPSSWIESYEIAATESEDLKLLIKIKIEDNPKICPLLPPWQRHYVQLSLGKQCQLSREVSHAACRAYLHNVESGTHFQFPSLQFSPRVRGWKWNDFKRNNAAVTILEVLLVTAYGAVHAAAWFSSFPTTAEMWMWRASCITLAGVVPVMLILALGGLVPVLVYDVLGECFPLLKNPEVENWLWMIWAAGAVAISLIAGTYALAYVFARVFLVVEAFISLRAVPIGVYAAIPWSDYFPHI